jgi:hypothetical protein
MSKNYILRIASATQQGIGMGMYLYLAFEIEKREPEEFACDLAAAATNYILMRTPPMPEQVEFGKLHNARAQEEALNLWTGSDKCELLSGAFYNIAYGRYLESGGGLLFNHFLTFIRSESQVGPLQYQRLNKLSTSILEPIFHLKKLRMWIPRGLNPNELTYFRAVETFTEHQRQRVTNQSKAAQ